MPPSSAPLSFCADQVRRFDHERYLVILCAPAAQREALFALHAFNLELARSRELVREPVMGWLRLQWWRDALEPLFQAETPEGLAAAGTQPVITPLATAIRTCRLSRPLLEQLIDAREGDFEPDAPATLAQLTAYAEATNAPLLHLSLEVLGVCEGAGAEAARQAACHVAAAWGLTGLMRALPFGLGQRRLFLPADRCAVHGVWPPRLSAPAGRRALAPVVAEVAAEARAQLAAARALRAQIPPAAVPALLSAVLADSHLDVLAASGHDAWTARVQMGHPWRVARLAWRAWRGRY